MIFAPGDRIVFRFSGNWYGIVDGDEGTVVDAWPGTCYAEWDRPGYRLYVNSENCELIEPVCEWAHLFEVGD